MSMNQSSQNSRKQKKGQDSKLVRPGYKI